MSNELDTSDYNCIHQLIAKNDIDTTKPDNPLAKPKDIENEKDNNDNDNNSNTCRGGVGLPKPNIKCGHP